VVAKRPAEFAAGLIERPLSDGLPEGRNSSRLAVTAPVKVEPAAPLLNGARLRPSLSLRSEDFPSFESFLKNEKTNVSPVESLLVLPWTRRH
jgi:hypothetical protein